MGLINMARGIVNTAKRERWLYNKAKEVSISCVNLMSKITIFMFLI